MIGDIFEPVADASEAGVGELRFDSDEGRSDPSGDVGPAHDQTGEPVPEPSDDSSLSEKEEAAKAVEETRANLVTKDEVRDKLKGLDGRWYVLHTYSGYERRVKQDLEMRMHSMNVGDYIFRIEVPMEEVFKIRRGQHKLAPHVRMPGYVLIRMDLTDDSWRVVQSTNGVTGFIGNGRTPVALSENEVVSMLISVIEAEVVAEAVVAEKVASPAPATLSLYATGDAATLTSEPRAGMSATASGVDAVSQRLTVLMTLVGQETLVELSFNQVRKDNRNSFKITPGRIESDVIRA